MLEKILCRAPRTICLKVNMLRLIDDFLNHTAVRKRTLRNSLSLMQLAPLLSVARQKKLRGLSPQANYTDRATATCRRS
jgi:hypothetical protein